MPYRVWVRAWVAREEVFEDRDSAELFRLKLAASRPTLNPSDVTVVSEHPSTPLRPRRPATSAVFQRGDPTVRRAAGDESPPFLGGSDAASRSLWSPGGVGRAPALPAGRYLG